MKKRPERWPIRKIAVAVAGCAAAAAVLFSLSALSYEGGGEETAEPVKRDPMFTISGFFMMFGVAAAVLGILGIGWLVIRVREARRPVWQRQGKRKRR
jgi:hypothetical protein